jgi:hypothetical protein
MCVIIEGRGKAVGLGEPVEETEFQRERMRCCGCDVLGLMLMQSLVYGMDAAQCRSHDVDGPKGFQ